MCSIVLDSNFNDTALNWGVDKSFFNSLGFDVLATQISENEIFNGSNQEVLEKYLELNDNVKKIGFFGFSNNPDALGFGDLFDDNVKEYSVFYSQEYDEIIGQSDKHKRDRFLIVLSKIFQSTFISSDYEACKRAKNFNVSVLHCVSSGNTKKMFQDVSVKNKSELKEKLVEFLENKLKGSESID